MRPYHRPSWWTEVFVPWATDRLKSSYFSRFPRNRCDVMSEDWDSLLVLDACRYDAFEEHSDIPGALEQRVSQGSYTGGFFEENVGDSRHYDTVYVTANPVPHVEEWCSVDIDATFHAVIDVWQDHWDKELNTVRPEPVARAIERAHNEYPDKRIMGHFVQPHQPFIGETGRDIETRGMRAYDRVSGSDAPAGKGVWEKLEDGDISTELAWQAYVENLEIVLPHVRRLCENLDGKTVVTSDHGNLFGEFAWPFPIREYGHPVEVHTKKLVTVPWLKTPFETRRSISAEPPTDTDSPLRHDDRIERLEALGYR